MPQHIGRNIGGLDGARRTLKTERCECESGIGFENDGDQIRRLKNRFCCNSDAGVKSGMHKLCFGSR